MQTNSTLKQTSNTLRVLYLLWMGIGIFSIMYVPNKLINWEDVNATTNNLVNNEFLYRAGILGRFITQLLFIPVVLQLNKLLKSINQEVSLYMVVLSLIAVPIAMVNTFNDTAALLSVSDPDQMMLYLKLSSQGIWIAEIFWGLWLFPLGYLVYKSELFPKIVGIALIIGGIGYTIYGTGNILSPDHYSLWSKFETLNLGEMVFVLWIILVGAKMPKEETRLKNW